MAASATCAMHSCGLVRLQSCDDFRMSQQLPQQSLSLPPQHHPLGAARRPAVYFLAGVAKIAATTITCDLVSESAALASGCFWRLLGANKTARSSEPWCGPQLAGCRHCIGFSVSNKRPAMDWTLAPHLLLPSRRRAVTLECLDKYPDTFDQLDMKALLSDKARIEAAIQCLDEDGDGACRPAGKLLKSVLAEIVKTDCAKCTETQKEKVGSFFAHVSQHYPEQMKKLLDKYDPSKEYRAKYAQKWAADGIKV